MGRKVQIAPGKLVADEKGQSLILVLVLMLVSSLTIAPLLAYMGTGLKTGQAYEEKAEELYAADAGVEDAVWQIQYDYLDSLFTSPTYDAYDYTTVWTYDLPEKINDESVTVTLENVWIPKDITPPNRIEARTIIETGKLIVAGSVPEASTYEIKITYYPGVGENLMMETLGIWLPVGFSYVEGSSNLEADPDKDYYSEPVIEPYAGGQAVIWSFGYVPFEVFPGIVPGASPMTSTVTFQFTSSQVGCSLRAVSWITTTGVDDIPLSWDADAKVFRITSAASDTEIEAYVIKSELRKLGSAIAGDYRAIGNTLMIDQYGGGPERDTLLAESDAVVNDIPSDAHVVAAYLYWSGWFEESVLQSIWEDDCANFNNWTAGIAWEIHDGAFRGHLGGGNDPDNPDRQLIMNSSVDLSSYASGTIMVSWEQWENGRLELGDALKFQFSGDGGSSWSDLITAFSNDIGSSPESFRYTIPDEYLTNDFEMRFYLEEFGDSGEYCYIDNFAIAESVLVADTSAIFRIDGTQVYFDEEGLPQIGVKEITASEWSVLENEPGEYSYSCYLDVTELVREFSEEGDYGNHPGNGTYTVGGVSADTDNDWSYAAWSLIIIYTSPETQGHQLHLYDQFIYSDMHQNIDFDGDGEPGGTITGFITPEPVAGEDYAAKLTAFIGEGDDVYEGDSILLNSVYLSNDESPWNNVWNSQSPGISEDGIDIDTFYISWESGLLEPDDSSAHVDLPTGWDSWNLVYIILSFRSATISSGTIHYLIRR